MGGEMPGTSRGRIDENAKRAQGELESHEREHAEKVRPETPEETEKRSIAIFEKTVDAAKSLAKSNPELKGNLDTLFDRAKEITFQKIEASGMKLTPGQKRYVSLMVDELKRSLKEKLEAKNPEVPKKTEVSQNPNQTEKGDKNLKLNLNLDEFAVSLPDKFIFKKGKPIGDNLDLYWTSLKSNLSSQITNNVLAPALKARGIEFKQAFTQGRKFDDWCKNKIDGINERLISQDKNIYEGEDVEVTLTPQDKITLVKAYFTETTFK